jgi:prepilin-type N-terminal cleavage/methylation domain-containing protein
MEKPHKNCAGFTLIEMLLVVFLIGLVASSMVLIVNDKDDQNRYEQTRVRYQAILDAILGTPKLSLNGQPLVNGFIADMGRLPLPVPSNTNGLNGVYGLDELIQHPRNESDEATDALKKVSDHPGCLITSGWRGPYLATFNQSLQDSWGADFEYEDDPLSVQSFGKDRAFGTDDSSEDDPNNFYEQDFPSSAVISENLYKPGDCVINLEFIRDENEGANNANQVLIGILYPGLDTSSAIGGDTTDYHESIILKDAETDEPFSIGDELESHAILLSDELPNVYIRKVQLVIYYLGTGSDLPDRNDSLEDCIQAIDDRILYLLPQNDSQYSYRIHLSI